eukprot:CAMPEP_0180823364 /NCGR_PEP_ID=MMETSP1038_2-20121128/71856_1 /TAXON_ID=632150 /ORGANISM="Azadinium spinosum, Strain 3D9" /LENGTH=32 /DNA_ID= /DNA_START= /DNA_END= /DNA_ORIENTATION=
MTAGESRTKRQEELKTLLHGNNPAIRASLTLP